ncbi:hypothetical protein CYMTET_28625 [Cymbomonas tetramitiformis]|uniref:glutamate decarboxylase n=1 Tax=Cymbomonas tetramitiformis TaxID=36881 RepID=A0AAE0FMG0_9CHLO|nr:hypothetical protein CYMTET_28625 [Cymbomonas tetramitiformis]|eukprot:gene20952-25140_t
MTNRGKTKITRSAANAGQTTRGAVANKRAKHDNTSNCPEQVSGDASETSLLRAEVESLRGALEEERRMNKLLISQNTSTYYASPLATLQHPRCSTIPVHGSPAQHCAEIITQAEQLDFKPRLNTSSYVNVVSEPEERDVMLLGLQVNIADQTVYPASFALHNNVVNMVASLWNCPRPDDFEEYGCYAGAGTVGSTEACLLAGLALKLRWMAWYARNLDVSHKDVRALQPNIVISTLFQAAWEKLFKYMGVEPKFISPKLDSPFISGKEVADACDEKTIGVVCIMGNHYGGHYDPVWEVDSALKGLNERMGWQIGIHVDAASGGFIAPFQPELPAWDFRLESVLSISASGHKFGASCIGTGWLVLRQRKDLGEHIAISVSYLGGKADSYTLNFSRPASGIYVQYYKFLRLGMSGYQALCDNMMANAKVIRDALSAMTHSSGRPRFQILDAGDTCCLPVVAARLNPELHLPYDDIDLQHALAEAHW